MKYTWELHDLKCGHYVYAVPPLSPKDEGPNIERIYKIGYSAKESSSEHLVLISMADGMTSKNKTPQEMIDHLNETNCRPFSLRELIRLLTDKRATSDWR